MAASNPFCISLAERSVAGSPFKLMVALIVFWTGLALGIFGLECLVPPLALSQRGHALVDAVVYASLGTSILWCARKARRNRQLRLAQELGRIRELNHTVRNALQVITDSHYYPEDARRRAVIENVTRIDLALRSLFPFEQGSSRPVISVPCFSGELNFKRH